MAAPKKAWLISLNDPEQTLLRPVMTPLLSSRLGRLTVDHQLIYDAVTATDYKS